MGTDTNSEPDNQLDAQEHSREERAFTLYCQGMRVAEIALMLAVSETTIRRWLHARLETLAQEERAERAEQLLRAIESQRSIASAAWRAYERERNEDEPDRHEGALPLDCPGRSARGGASARVVLSHRAGAVPGEYHAHPPP
jgi:hypothetical protein